MGPLLPTSTRTQDLIPLCNSRSFALPTALYYGYRLWYGYLNIWVAIDYCRKLCQTFNAKKNVFTRRRRYEVGRGGQKVGGIDR